MESRNKVAVAISKCAYSPIGSKAVELKQDLIVSTYHESVSITTWRVSVRWILLAKMRKYAKRVCNITVLSERPFC